MLGRTLPDYELLIYALQDECPAIRTSTLTVIRQASNVATVEGKLFFPDNLRMHVMTPLKKGSDKISPKLTLLKKAKV